MRSISRLFEFSWQPVLAAGFIASAWTAGAVTSDSTAGAAPSTAPASTVSGAPPNNPYLVITNRNAFAIKPPPPPPDPKANTPPPPPPNLFVTGFSRLKGVKKAYLVLNRPGKQPDYLVVDEAYDVDGLKVVSIDPKRESLTVVNSGTEVTLNFKDNGMKPGIVPNAPMGGPNGVVQPVPGLPGGGGIPRPTPQVYAPGSPGAPAVIRRGGMEALPSADPQESDVPAPRNARRGVYLGGSSGTPPAFITEQEPANPNLPVPSAASVPAAPGVVANPGSGRQAPPVPYLGR